MTVIGGCFCGCVRYRINTHTDESCSCSAHTEAFVAPLSDYTEITPESFSWLNGEEHLTLFEYTPGWSIGFCKICGTTLCGMQQGKVHGVNLGTADSSNRTPLELH